MSKARELSKLPNYVLSTVAELKLAVGKEQGDKAFVGGYYADGDGGSGDFYWDAVSVEADNGGTIFQVTGTTTGRWKRIYSGAVNVKWFGAKGDGVTDDTTVIQNSIYSLSIGDSLDGGGKTYIVTSLYLMSYMTLLNFKFITKSGSTPFRSPITIDGTLLAKTDINIINVYVDGNRINQTNITVPSAEDGSLHGIRCIGTLSNLYLERVHVSYCGSYGILLLSSMSVGAADSDFVFNNITIKDSSFSNNRAHGMAADSVNGLVMDNVMLNNNGNDLNGTDPLTSGGRGATVDGNYYGSGFDFEGYGIGSSFKNVKLSNVTALNNARMGGLFYDQLDTRPIVFAARQKIWISDSYFDKGISVNSDGSGLQFTSTLSSKTLASLYDSVYITNTRVDGFLLARCVNNLQFSGEINSTVGDSFLILDYATRVQCSAITSGTSKLVSALNSTYSFGIESQEFPPNPVLTNVGAAGTLNNIVCTQVENIRDRTFRFLITADWLVTTVGTTPIFRITPSGNSTIVVPPRLDIISSATALPILASYDLSTNYAKFIDNEGVVLNIQFIVDVKV
jgi:hypothetical protein